MFMIVGNQKRISKLGFELQSSHVIETSKKFIPAIPVVKEPMGLKKVPKNIGSFWFNEK